MIYNQKKYKIPIHIIYWIFSAFFIIFFFGQVIESPKLTFLLISIILPQTILVTYTINYYLIPRFLFQKRYFLFGYMLLFLILLSVWINLISLSVILLTNLNLGIIPSIRDFKMLLSGNYLVVFFAVVVHFINESYNKNKTKEEIEQKQNETELKLKEAKFELLKGQIYPHFLFNVLNNIYGLTLTKPEKAGELILKISDLLDYMLYKCNNDFVLLKNEMDFLSNYIEVEKIRSDKRLNINMDLQLNDKDVLVPPLLFFPFVENAFKHSSKNNSNERNIKILMRFNKGLIIFRVENNYIQNKYTNLQTGGLGLKNIKQRLKLIYQNNYYLNINDDGNQYIIVLKIPFRKIDSKK